jgi:hypothetical protein
MNVLDSFAFSKKRLAISNLPVIQREHRRWPLDQKMDEPMARPKSLRACDVKSSLATYDLMALSSSHTFEIVGLSFARRKQFEIGGNKSDKSGEDNRHLSFARTVDTKMRADQSRNLKIAAPAATEHRLKSMIHRYHRKGFID